MRSGRFIAVALPVLTIASLAGERKVFVISQRETPPAVQPADSPAGPNSAQPQLSVSNRGVLMSWIERDGPRATLKFSERAGSAWSPPLTVASGADWFVNWADVPSVVRLADGRLVAHWLQKSGPDTYAYDVRLSHSKDNGTTWSPSFLPHHDGTKTEHGFASLFQMPGAGLGLVWLDGRAMTGDSHGSGSTSGPPGDMTLHFGAFDGSWKQTVEQPVDLRVCECCPTTAAVTNEGPIVAFRNRTEGEIRDIYVSRLEKGRWSEPVPVANDNWKINACPVNGPMLAARGRSVVVAWFTGADSQPRVSVAFSRDSGRTFGAPIRVDENGALGRVDVELLDDGSALVSWINFADRKAEFRFRRVESSGAMSSATVVTPLRSDRSNGYPRIARHRNELVLAWTQNDAAPNSTPVLRVMTAAAKLHESLTVAWRE